PLARLMYGPAAPAVLPVLRALAPLVPAQFLALFLAAALAALGREKSTLRVLMASVSGGLLADLLLIPTFGARGAAWGLLTGTLIQCVLLTAAAAPLARRAAQTRPRLAAAAAV